MPVNRIDAALLKFAYHTINLCDCKDNFTLARILGVWGNLFAGVVAMIINLYDPHPRILRLRFWGPGPLPAVLDRPGHCTLPAAGGMASAHNKKAQKKGPACGQHSLGGPAIRGARSRSGPRIRPALSSREQRVLRP